MSRSGTIASSLRLAGPGVSGWAGACAALALGISALVPVPALAASQSVLSLAPELPLYFEPAPVTDGHLLQAQARGRDYAFLVSPTGVQFTLWKREATDQNVVAGRVAKQGIVHARSAQMEFLGANANGTLEVRDALPGKLNYLCGNDPAKWRSSVSIYSRVAVQGIYPGIDLVYYGNPQQLEYDFAVSPGSDPSRIQWQFTGVDKLSIGKAGELVIRLGDGEIRQPAPYAYQDIDGTRRQIAASYRITGGRTVGFDLGTYEPHHPVIIDPVFSYSTYFGGNNGDAAYAVKVDGTGAVYIAGATLSAQFSPMPTGGFQPSFKGGGLTGDAFVAKFDNTGRNLVYFTYLGGSHDDGAYDMALNAAGNVYLTGFTDSTDFPLKNPLFSFLHGTPDVQLNIYPNDAFVAELNAAGNGLVFSTYLGGNEEDAGVGIAVDANGYIYVTGYTDSANFPYKTGYQNWYGGNDDAFVTKFTPGGTALVYSTYLGGFSSDRGEGIAADSTGAAYVTGHTYSTNFPYARGYQNWHGGGADAFVTKINANGALGYSTYLGGGYDDFGYRIAVDNRRNAWVTGTTLSYSFPHANPIAGLSTGNNGTNAVNYDAFLTCIGTNGSLVSSAMFGGPGTDAGWDLAIDSAGRIFVIGTTASTNFPVVNASGLFRTNLAGGRDVFVVAVQTNATAALYSGYLGGTGDDFGYGIAVDAEGSAYVAGLTYSTNFPTAFPYQNSKRGVDDAFLAKIRLMDPALLAQVVGNALVLSWPITAPEYHLESTASLTPPVTWTVVPYAPVINQNSYTVTLGLTNGIAAFRLAR